MLGASAPLAAVNVCVVIGNLFVLYVIMSQKSLHSSTNSLVLSLTISDLLLGILILPFAIAQEHMSTWAFGSVGCRLWLSLDVWFSTASIYNLLAISFDRYMAVRQPIKYPIISSTKVVRLMTSLVWLCSLALACVLFGLETWPHVFSESPENAVDAGRQCMPTTLPSLYIIFSALASFVLPAIVMTLLNIQIFCTVLTTSRKTTVFARDGTSMRVHRGHRKRTSKKFKREDSKQEESFSQKETSKKTSNAGTSPPPAELLVPTPTLRTFLSHALVFGVIEAKKTNLLHHITQRRLTRSSIRTELRVARTTAVVVAAFVVCWIPFTTIYVLQAYSLCTVEAGCIPDRLYVVAFWLGYSNSAVNPILYAAFSRDFRSAFRRLVCRRQK
ncbi:unnamed protein product [Caenorhabditis auriculariae]|uniref:G-protein coupled receptors family 1 profile domain-containing protein n=1 Tax=Caenorhabditis auriculariae TaxID=2777116 RepID=A0A8S1H7P4_9PELO|nr:unnamed protein product [Caenorhabditis auriculariae]